MSQRPIECSKCSKPLCINYKEIEGDQTHSFSACSGCPIVHQKLHGSQEATDEVEKTLCCENCQTSLADIRQGHTVGCASCYEIFEDAITSELKDRNLFPSSDAVLFSIEDESDTLHVGKTPFDTSDLRLSKRLTNLNEALNEALKIENYEQAAWLRDRIKSLSESTHEQAS